MANPKKAADALAPVGQAKNLHRFTAGSSLLLQQLENPIAVQTKEKRPLTDYESLEIVFVLSRPARDVAELLAEGGKAAVRAAVIEYADELEPSQVAPLCEEAGRLIGEARGVAPGGAQGKKGR